jgi:hypothetical protein
VTTTSYDLALVESLRKTAHIYTEDARSIHPNYLISDLREAAREALSLLTQFGSSSTTAPLPAIPPETAIPTGEASS